ncbi:STAS domain-containing protein [Kitasatospora sp. NPDC091207]|uniref:STAS domain-containing protein n=1 Tax=Kitasatospora sp. NPDC091207 TaxID=3364083 RepID=UPI00382BE2FC
MPDSVPEPTPAPRHPGEGPGAVRLRVGLRAEGGTVVVSPVGELDHDSAALLRARLREAIGQADDRVVVDCHGLAFCDSTGLNLLLTTRAEAERADLALVLAGLRPPVARMFEVTGARAVFDIRADLGSALAG